jgi:hypothetical protein
MFSLVFVSSLSHTNEGDRCSLFALSSTTAAAASSSPPSSWRPRVSLSRSLFSLSLLYDGRCVVVVAPATIPLAAAARHAAIAAAKGSPEPDEPALCLTAATNSIDDSAGSKGSSSA